MPHNAALLAISDENNLVKKRSVILMGHATSITLEDIFWDKLNEIAGQQNKSRNALIAEIDEYRKIPLSSALRIYCLCYELSSS